MVLHLSVVVEKHCWAEGQTDSDTKSTGPGITNLTVLAKLSCKSTTMAIFRLPTHALQGSAPSRLGSQIGILVPGLDSIPVPLVTGLNLSPIPKIPSTALYMPNPLYPSVPS